MLKIILIVAIGGAIGSVCRFLTSVFIQKYTATFFPLATFIANILGCLLIGIAVGLLEKNNLTNSLVKWFFITGFCGGYTTFSAFGMESIALFQNQQSGLALANIGLSIIFGLLAVWFGLYLVK